MKKNTPVSNNLKIRVNGIGFDKEIEIVDGLYETFIGALAANNIVTTGYQLFVNGEEYTSGDELQDGDIVQVVKNEKNAAARLCRDAR